MNHILSYEEKCNEDLITAVSVVVGFLIGHAIVALIQILKYIIQSKKIEKSVIHAIDDISKKSKGLFDARKLKVVKGPSTISVISDRSAGMSPRILFSFQLNTVNNTVDVIIQRRSFITGEEKMSKEIHFDVTEDEKEEILNIIYRNLS